MNPITKQELIKFFKENGGSISPFGWRVLEMMSDINIFKLHSNAWLLKQQWGGADFVQITIRTTISTVDDAKLTNLVLAAHDRLIRVELTGRAVGMLDLRFSPRTVRDGKFHEEHPDIDGALVRYRRWLEAASETTPIGAASEKFIARDYHVDDRTTYSSVIHSTDDEPIDHLHSMLRSLMLAAGIVDGDEFEVVVRKTARRPFGKRKWVFKGAGVYRPDDEPSPQIAGTEADHAKE